MIPIQDSWSRSKFHEILVIGNGPSRKEGLEQLQKNKSIGYVSINQVFDSRDPIFVIATRKSIAIELGKILPSHVPIVVPETFDLPNRFTNVEKISFDYLESSINIGNNIGFREDFVLMTILEILDNLSTELEFIKVSFYGFDFKYSKIPHDRSKTFLELLLQKQKSLARILSGNLGSFKKLRFHNSIISDLELDQVGIQKENSLEHQFEDQDIEEAILRNNFLISESLRKASLGEVQVVAEFTNNHCGDSSRLYEMVLEAKAQGANLIKVQKREPDTFYTNEQLNSAYKSPFGSTLGEYRRGVELSQKQFDLLTFICVENDIPWFASVLDLPSLNFISRYDPILIKIPSTISRHKNFILSIAETAIPNVIVSLGGTNEEYVQWIGGVFQSRNLFLMQCTSSYPAELSDLNIRVLTMLKVLAQKEDLFLGYSSHDPGSLGSQLAVALGAVLIEKHVKYGNVDWIHFDGVALDLKKNELHEFTQDLHTAISILGSPHKQIQDSEHHKYQPNENAN